MKSLRHAAVVLPNRARNRLEILRQFCKVVFNSQSTLKTKISAAGFPTSIILSLAIARILFCGWSARAQTGPVISNVYPNGTIQFQPSA